MADVQVTLVIDEENLHRLKREQTVESIQLRAEGDAYRLFLMGGDLVWPESYGEAA